MPLLVLVAAVAALYGLHRLALHLESRGHLYYTRKKRSGGAMSAFVALQRAIEPPVEHVLVLNQPRHDTAPSPAGPPDADLGRLDSLDGGIVEPSEPGPGGPSA